MAQQLQPLPGNTTLRTVIAGGGSGATPLAGAASSPASTSAPATTSSLDPQRLLPFRSFGKGSTSEVNSMSFHRSGKFLVTASDDGIVNLFNPLQGEKLAVLATESGSQFIQYTHSNAAIVYANSDVAKPGINYVSLHTQRCISSFAGHAGSPITCVAMSMHSDQFMSAAKDGTVRLWDLREPRKCAAQLKTTPPDGVQGNVHITFDPTSQVVTACLADGTLCLFDAKQLQQPFEVSRELASVIRKTNERSVKPGYAGRQVFVEDFLCSGNGLFFTAAMSNGDIHLIESMKGSLRQSVSRKRDLSDSHRLGIAISPNSEYLCAGLQDGSLCFWGCSSSSDGSAMHNEGSAMCNVHLKMGASTVIKPFHNKCARAIAWNPQYAQFASAESKTVFWMPTAAVDE